MSAAHQAIINRRFPSIVLDPVGERFDGEEESELIHHAYFVPNNRVEEFADYMLDEFCGELERAGLPYIGILACTESQTRKHYPHVVAARAARGPTSARPRA